LAAHGAIAPVSLSGRCGDQAGIAGRPAVGVRQLRRSTVEVDSAALIAFGEADWCRTFASLPYPLCLICGASAELRGGELAC